MRAVMRLPRRLRIVRAQPKSAVDVAGYGFGGGRKITQLAHSPLANESNITARAMSIRWHTGNHDTPTVEEAKAIIQRSERASRRQVTVPQPREPTALRRSPAARSPYSVAARESAAANHSDTQPGDPGKDKA